MHSIVRARAAALTAAVASSAMATLAMVPAHLEAQAAPASTCTIDQNSPKELALVGIKFGQARGATAPDARKAALMAVTKELDTKPERYAKNAVGYAYVRSQVLGMWAVEPGIGYMPTRGAIGLNGNPAEPYDLIAGMDSAFTAIQTGSPTCAADVAGLRQNDVWLALTRRALDASNSSQLDSAEFYAKRSMSLSASNPYPHYILGNVANQKGDKAGAVSHWKQVVQTAGSDTSYRELKSSTTYYMGMTQLELAGVANGAAKQAAARDAVESLLPLITGAPEGPDTPNIMSAVADAMTMAGDSTKLPSVYAPLLADVSKYNDFSLTMGGVIATRAGKPEDAAKLFEGAIARNPNARDALRNLAATYYTQKQYAKMFSPVSRLTAIDPNNFDAWMFNAYAAQGLGQATKVAAEKKAWTDSLVKYNTLAEGLPLKVEVSAFTRATKDGSLTLEFEGNAATPAAYTATVDFLDGAGAVVGTDAQPVGTVAKGAKKKVTFKATGANIIAYRYKLTK